MSLLNGLVWYWDLSSADATITDQHSGLVLSRIGTTTTDSTGGPDGGPAISFGAAQGKYRTANIAKTIAYESGFTCNIWAYNTGESSLANWVFNHRNDTTVTTPDNRYFQIRSWVASLNGLDGVVSDAALTSQQPIITPKTSLNVWAMLTLAHTGTESRLYRNGVHLATSTTALGARSTGVASIAIGGPSWTGIIETTAHHRGRLAMAGSWGRVLSDSEITALYNGGNGRRYADLPITTDRRRNNALIGLL